MIANEGRGFRPTVLIVDDELEIREMSRIWLQNRGYDAITAENGNEALDLLLNDKVSAHVVVTDLSMPGMDGLMLISSLRLHHVVVPAVIVSGTYYGDVSNALQESEDVFFMSKPYRMKDLRMLLDQITGREVTSVIGK